MLSWPIVCAARRLPSASRLPSPSREPISSMARSSALAVAEPQPRFVQPSPLDTLHREGDGAAGADRVEAELVAAPGRAQDGVGVADAAQRAEREQAFVFDANAAVSGSRRCARSRSCMPRSCRASSNGWRVSCSGDRFAAPSKLPLWKLRVGSALKRLNVRRFVAVPSSRYFAVAGPNERFDRSRLIAVTSR